MRNVAMVTVLGFCISCGVFNKKNNNGPGGGTPGIVNMAGMGCVQGVVRNGLSGERVPLKLEGETAGVFVLVRNRLIPAAALVADASADGANKNLVGEYYLCGFPLDETFPLFVWQDGYEAYEGRIRVASTLPQRSVNSDAEDRTRVYPTLLADIEIFKKGVETKDLKFNVYLSGAPSVGAKVTLTPTRNHVIAGQDAPASGNADPYGDSFVKSLPQIRSVPLQVVTNDQGVALFAAADLALGLGYDYVVMPPDGGASGQVMVGEAPIYVGLRGQGTNLVGQPFEVSVSLGQTTKAPTVVYSSLEGQGYHSGGVLTLVFDQAVELTPRSVESLQATLTGAAVARLAAGSESLTHSFSPDNKILTLAPKWEKSPAFPEDKDARVTFQGLIVRPIGDTRKSVHTDLGSLVVPLQDR